MQQKKKAIGSQAMAVLRLNGSYDTQPRRLASSTSTAAVKHWFMGHERKNETDHPDNGL